MRVETENVVMPPTQANSSQQGQQVDTPGHGGGGGSKVRLPKLHLPSFNGNFKDWSAFWDSFDSAINSNQSLTPIERFYFGIALVSHFIHELNVIFSALLVVRKSFF